MLPCALRLRLNCDDFTSRVLGITKQKCTTVSSFRISWMSQVRPVRALIVRYPAWPLLVWKVCLSAAFSQSGLPTPPEDIAGPDDNALPCWYAPHFKPASCTFCERAREPLRGWVATECSFVSLCSEGLPTSSHIGYFCAQSWQSRMHWISTSMPALIVEWRRRAVAANALHQLASHQSWAGLFAFWVSFHACTRSLVPVLVQY